MREFRFSYVLDPDMDIEDIEDRMTSACMVAIGCRCATDAITCRREWSASAGPAEI